MTGYIADAASGLEAQDAEALRAAFDATAAYEVGLEDEVMLLEPDSLELLPRASELLARLGDGRRFKLELPASQLEILTPPSTQLALVEAALREARETAAQRADGLVRLAAAGAHPFSPGVGELNRTSRYEHTVREYGAIATRQLVCALQIHVSVGDSGRALAVYNSLRSYLPLLAALAANAPFYEGVDTGLASVRPKLAELLPRQGVPPPIESWEDYAETLRWGARAGAFADVQTWWWELRLHPRFGTLELRVPDSQSSVSDAIALAAFTQALVAWLGDRHDAGELLPIAASWRIEENRWSACRDGIEGSMADLHSGEPRPTRACLHELLELVGPAAHRLGNASALEGAERLIDANGALGQRRAASTGGTKAATRWLIERFLE